MPARLVPARYLDPRPAAEAAAQPLADAVNIPLAELPGRMHELPPRAHVIEVAAEPDLAARAVEQLRAAGRRATGMELPPAAPTRVRARLWQPTSWLEQVARGLAPGRALDLACGTGRDAVFLASIGWEVTAVDILPDALERGRDLARRYAPAAPPIDWQEADLAREVPPDWGTFDLVCCFRFFHRALLRRIPLWLCTNGSALLECFTRVHQQRFGRPAAADRVPDAGELPKRLEPLTIVAYDEGWHEDAHTARIWGMKVNR